MRVGIPNALYFEGSNLMYKTFFNELGIDVIFSGVTTNKIKEEGIRISTSESCLASKIFIGHVDSLVKRSKKENIDYIFVPRLCTYKKNETECVKFYAMYDICKNLFDANFITLNLDYDKGMSEITSYVELANKLGINPLKAYIAYIKAKRVCKLEKEATEKYLDIVAIGTVSDIVPLLDENRIISKYGIKMIENTDNVGLRALLNIVNFKNLDSTMISFGLAPRINACGRMGNASLAVKLFLEENEEVARELAITLDKLNSKRQQIEKEIYESAMKVIEEKKLYNKSSIVLYNEGWHSGVIGIVASRIVNMYNKPVILLIKENGMIRGSGRCAKGISLYESLDKCKEDLIQFGGHELAAGLSMEEENVEKFIYDFENVICEKLGGEELSQVVDIDFEISLSDLNVELLKDIYTLKPYGQSNRAPLFLYRNLRVQAVRTIGDGKHLKLVLKDKNKYIDVVGFSQGEKRDAITIGDKIDVVCEVELNEYNGKRTIQLILQDFKKSI